MLSKFYESIRNIFNIFPEIFLSIFAFVVGLFSLVHAFYMVIRAMKQENVNFRELGESFSVFACAIFLISPMFNTLFYIKFLSFILYIPDEIVSYLSFGLIPISVFYLIDMFRFNGTD